MTHFIRGGGKARDSGLSQAPYKPKKSEGYALCDALFDGHCTCRIQGRTPCDAWLFTLHWCHACGIRDPVEYERRRISNNMKGDEP